MLVMQTAEDLSLVTANFVAPSVMVTRALTKFQASISS